MKRTLQKFSISNRLDVPGTPQPLDIKDVGLASFADSVNSLDQRLRASRTPAPEPPPWLHASIMNEVSCATAERVKHPQLRLPLAAWACAAACIVVVATIWVLMPVNHPRQEVALNTGQSEADGVVRLVAVQGAVALMEPFESELANLSRDVNVTTDFLLASLP